MTTQGTLGNFKPINGILPVINIEDIENGRVVGVIKLAYLREWTKNNPINIQRPTRIIKAERFQTIVLGIAQENYDVKDVSNICKIVVEGEDAGDFSSVKVEVKTEELLLRLSQKLHIQDGEVERIVNIGSVGSVNLAIKMSHSEIGVIKYQSLFVGLRGDIYEYSSLKDAAESTRLVIQNIVSGKKVLLKNVKIFTDALDGQKISLVAKI